MKRQNKILKEQVKVAVTQLGETVKNHLEVDKMADRIIGIAIVADKDDLMFYRGSQKISISDEEFFPEGYQSKLIMCGLNVAPDDRMVRFGEVDPGNRKVEITYTDTESSYARFEPYTVTLWVYSHIKPD